MDILVVLALAVALVMCLLPGIMAWSHYLDKNRHPAESKRPAARRNLQPARVASK